MNELNDSTKIGFHCRHIHLTGIVCMLPKSHDGNHEHNVSWKNDEPKKAQQNNSTVIS